MASDLKPLKEAFGIDGRKLSHVTRQGNHSAPVFVVDPPQQRLQERSLAHLVECYESLPTERKREFWQLRCTRGEKLMYLLTYGSMAVCN